MYRIIARCDPYNARMHYNGQEVLKYDGTTPVAWVWDDDLTLDEANDEIFGYACEQVGYSIGSWAAVCRWGFKYGIDAFTHKKDKTRVLRDDSVTFSVEKK
ncbi:MAG: hypothetical protein J6Y20_04900 [Lachnospiraceae bacterium]|nr:hypothetical protein [Kiritimatiellia bacterium]MBP5461445.1 hypothetical protein [Lachnospiraceae bacterium]